MSHIKEIIFPILLLFLIKDSSADLLSSFNVLKHQFERIGEDIFPKVFNEKSIKEQYKFAYNTGLYNLTPVNEQMIAKTFSQQLEKELRKKMEALRKTVDFAEDQARNYKWNQDITISNVSYIRSKNMTSHTNRLVDHPLFKTKVIVDQSSVHVPTEIYDEDRTILNAIKWMSSLNEAFNINKDALRYQYFASSTGVVMQYPGMQWIKKEVDMYDVRRRPWFVQGASSPKDIMILIDTSGSMHGISIALTKIAVQKLIDTMGENDYIAVAQFPGYLKERDKIKSQPHLLMNQSDPMNIIPCFDRFVQASKRNKDLLFTQINQLKALGIADLDDALEFGIRQFHLFDTNNTRPYEGANCNRIILVLTDGGDDYDREKIKLLLNESTKTSNMRIFIYSVGEEISPTDSLNEITCDFRGFFGHIRAIGAVNNIIEGLGLMTSLTMPVYNRSGNGTFLGLLGTDMTVDFMNHLVPQDMLGPNGYAFAINTNGYIIFHPELKVQRGWMRDPPNVDLTEVEFNSYDKTQLRREVINCAASNGTARGEMDVRSFIKVVDEIHTYEKVRKYAYHGIPLSTFGVTIVNPTFNKYYPAFSDEIRLSKVEVCNHIKCVINLLLPNKYSQRLTFSKEVYIYAEKGLLDQCKIIEEERFQEPSGSKSLESTVPLIQQTTSQLLPISTFGSSISTSITMVENITLSSSTRSSLETSDNLTMTSSKQKFSEELIKILRLVGNKSTNKCPDYESRRLLVDLIVLESIVNSLNLTSLDKLEIKSIAVAMVSGITLVYPESDKHVYSDLFYSSWNSPIFQRTFDMDKIIFYTAFHRHYTQDNATDEFKHNDVMMFKAFSADHPSDMTIPAAVLGITLRQSAVMDILRSSDACSDWRVCYLLEDGGYIVSVSDPALLHQIGYFFGVMHVSIMRTLVNNSVFLSIEEYDYQASCPRPRENDTSSSAASRVLQALTALPIKIIRILVSYTETIISIVKLTIQCLLISVGNAQETTASNNENVSCIKKTYRYYLPDVSDPDRPVEISQSCDNCNFSVVSQRFKNSNLLLLTFAKNCSTVCQQINVEPMLTTPVKDPGPDLCALSKQPNYRLRPEYKCYEFDPNEDFTRCSAHKLLLSLSVMLIITICKSLEEINVYF